jgi:Ca2+-binding EF-hand superfamily protein
MIIYQIIEAAKRSQIDNMADLFSIMDKQERGFIARQDFEDLFHNLNLTG